MLSTLARVLHEQGFASPLEQPAFNVNLISQQQLTLQAFLTTGERFHARIKRRGVAADEYESCRNAWQAYPQYAPEPLGRYFEDQWEIIVVRGIPHEMLASGDIARDRRGVVAKLAAYFAAGRKAPSNRHTSPARHRDFLRQVRKRTEDRNAAAVLDAGMANHVLDRLPSIPQHGDFTVNNLALNQDRLVIFDWEDFGRVHLPGLDLCCAIASDAGLEPHRLAQVGRGRYRPLIEAACPALGLTPDLFVRMMPLYLAVFLDLKQRYGASIRAAIRDLIPAMTGAPS